MPSNIPVPVDIQLLQKSRLLKIVFDNKEKFELPCEYLRVYSPSAEVRGHGADEGVLVSGKKNVNVINIEPVGNYAIRLFFDDGHDTGIFSWEILYMLSINYAENWRRYLERLFKANLIGE